MQLSFVDEDLWRCASVLKSCFDPSTLPSDAQVEDPGLVGLVPSPTA